MWKWIIGTAVVVVIGVGAYLYQYGGWRVKRDMAAFATPLADCTPFEQAFYDPLSRKMLERSIIGPEGETCAVQFATYGPEPLVCGFAIDDMPAIAASFLDQAKNVDYWGNMTVSYDSANRTPLEVAMDRSCTTE